MLGNFCRLRDIGGVRGEFLQPIKLTKWRNGGYEGIHRDHPEFD